MAGRTGKTYLHIVNPETKKFILIKILHLQFISLVPTVFLLHDLDSDLPIAEIQRSTHEIYTCISYFPQEWVLEKAGNKKKEQNRTLGPADKKMV